MVATNLFNNALRVDLDEYLWAFRKSDTAAPEKWSMSEVTPRPANLAGQVALVTGAAHGQGRASALALAREGAHVLALDVARALEYPGYGLGTGADLDSLREACGKHGVECLTFAADVRDDAAVSAAVAAAVERFGRIDILFNNAGICAYGLAHELTEDAWDTMLDINLKEGRGSWPGG